MADMATGVFRLKGSKLLEIGKRKGVENIHQISMRSGISYPTTRRYIETPEQVEAVSLRALYGVLVDGIGMTREEVAGLRFGDVFDMISDKETGAK